MTRTVETDLGDGEDTLVITLRGKACRLQDLQDMIAALLRQETKRTPEHGQAKPFGCQEK
ncbi:hypothetical protein EON81_05430 [bacterium]|nr:MAG: hypothetical protein EON81_05430 [bacterium]